MSMVALIPNEISDAALVSSSIAEPDLAFVTPNGVTGEVLWVSGVTYAEDDRVVRETTHRRYRRTAVSGAATRLPESSPLLWIDEGPSNKWAWADSQASTRTVGSSPYTVTVQPGVCTDIEIYGLENVDIINVTMLDEAGGEVVFDLETTTDEYASSDPHWSFYFDGPTQGDSFSLSGLPVHPGGEIEITLSSYDGEAIGVGLIAFGSYEPLGIPEFGFEAIYRDYGYTVTNQWGESQRYPGAKGKDLRGSCLLTPAEANGVDNTIRRLLDVGAVFVPSQEAAYRYLKTWGQIKPARIQAAGHERAIVEVEIEGLI